jgi:hypothetical protein
MGLKGVHLREFKEEELLFNEDETRAVLNFFFPNDKEKIATIEITAQTRSFAQGLMVEAVDASYAMGFIELTFKWVSKPNKDVSKAIKKLIEKGAGYWFKHLRAKSPISVEIYDSVKNQLTAAFRKPFLIMLDAKLEPNDLSTLFAFVDYQRRC